MHLSVAIRVTTYDTVSQDTVCTERKTLLKRRSEFSLKGVEVLVRVQESIKVVSNLVLRVVFHHQRQFAQSTLLHTFLLTVLLVNVILELGK